MLFARGPDINVIKELVEKTSIFIEDERLRRRMGIAGRREIEAGKFSIKRRNEKLKRIFGEAIGF
jgi:glycosyltransferase involved in cell wall biosynthesis